MFKEEILIIVKDFNALSLIKLKLKYNKKKLLYYFLLSFRSFDDDIIFNNYINFS